MHYLLGSYILVHLLALFGIFVAIAYPVWWLVFPRKTVCFLCRARADGSMCPVCRQKVHKREGVYPRTFLSVLQNAALILFLSLIAMAAVLFEARYVLGIPFPPTRKTVSFIIPAKKQYKLGEVFLVNLEIDGVETSINAVQVDLAFNPSQLELVDFCTEKSFANVFVQKEISNELGYARLTGGLPNPGFSGEKGLFAIAYFRAKNPGLAEVEFLPSSLVLANDGKGTNVLKEIGKSAHVILPEELSKEEYEKQEQLLSSVVLGRQVDISVEEKPKLVLGDEADDQERVQLIFYEETDVLGTESGSKLPEIKDESKFPDFVSYITLFDSLIISLWGKLVF